MNKILALDVGLKRIGVALGVEGITLPLPPIFRKNRDQASNEVRNLLQEHTIDTLVVGIPKEGESSEEMTRRIKHFVNLLSFEGEIVFIDESFSSFEAKEESKGIFRHKSDGRIDSLAAKVILERYYSSLHK